MIDTLVVDTAFFAEFVMLYGHWSFTCSNRITQRLDFVRSLWYKDVVQVLIVSYIQ